MFTGLYPSVHGVTYCNNKLDARIPTLAEILKTRGIHTAGFISNPELNSEFGFARGFDLYDQSSVFVGLDIAPDPYGYLKKRKREIPGPSILSTPTSGILNKVVFNWLKTHHKEQFFLFLHYFDPHYDYHPPPPYNTMFDPGYKGPANGSHMLITKSLPDRDLEHVKALYDGEIRYTDEHIGLLLKEMARYELTDKTLVIIIADHGEEFYDHGGFTHGFTLYDEVTSIPFLIKFPGQTIPQVIDGLVSDVDILPTVCDYLKIKIPENVQGESLLPLCRGEKKEIHSFVFSELDNHASPEIRTVETHEYKLIRNFHTRQTELFSLKDDSAEKKNLFPAGFFHLEPATARKMKRELKRFMKTSDRLSVAIKKMQTNKVILDEKTRQRLKSLGYIQ
jgi:arylsulfatase A-like enzyme